MHALSAVVDTTCPLDAFAQLPHPTDPRAIIAFVGSSENDDTPLLWKVTRVDGEAARRTLTGLAHALTRVRHPNVVALREVRIQSAGVYTITEHVEGICLTSVLQEAEQRRDGSPGIPVAVSLRIMVDLLEGLSALHEVFAPLTNAVIHGEIRPSSILVGADGRSRIEQLGGVPVAQFRLSAEERDGAAYRAPEQGVGVQVDERADVYAAGAVLWALLAGRQPFTGTKDDVLHAMVRGEVPAPVGLLRIAPELVAVLKRALDPLPENRFGSALAFAEAIRSVGARFNVRFSHDAVAEYVEIRLGDELLARRSQLRIALSQRAQLSHIAASVIQDAFVGDPVVEQRTMAFERPTLAHAPISVTMTSAVLSPVAVSAADTARVRVPQWTNVRRAPDNRVEADSAAENGGQEIALASLFEETTRPTPIPVFEADPVIPDGVPTHRRRGERAPRSPRGAVLACLVLAAGALTAMGYLMSHVAGSVVPGTDRAIAVAPTASSPRETSAPPLAAATAQPEATSPITAAPASIHLAVATPPSSARAIRAAVRPKPRARAVAPVPTEATPPDESRLGSEMDATIGP